ncbi:MAG TPA: mechanosensitive ion channel [Nocardioides sp.]
MNDIDWAGIAQKAAIAIAILVVTWILAKIVKAAFTKLGEKIPALSRTDSNGQSGAASLASIASLLVWLFGLVAILQVLGLSQVLTPIRGMLATLLGFLPNIIGAGVVFFIGLLLAKIVRQLIETALGAVPFEKWASSASSRVGQETGTARTTDGTTTTAYDSSTATHAATSDSGSALSALPRTIATVVFALIMIVVTIAALQILGIESISNPAEQMLTTIFDAIPDIIAALIMLAIGVMIAKFAGDILAQVLEGFGLDRSLHSMEVLPADKSASPVIAKIVQIAIVLFFAVMAAQMLNFPAITNFLSEVLELGGKVLFGGAIIAAGFFVANLLARMVSGTAGTILKYATLVLFIAMGLKYMGIADSIIELAFGALVVGGAAAAALAFGLGGRDAAARQLEEMRSSAGTRTGTSTGMPPAGGTTPPTSGI